jgi:competence protein ComEC
MRKLIAWPRVLLGAAFVVAIIWLAWTGLPDGRLHIWFLDVGQGDAILIQSPDGRQILVDGGPSPSALLDQLGEVMPFWDRSLDLVVLTHPDADHLSGLIPLFERYKVATVVDAVMPGAKGAAPWIAALDAVHVTRAQATRGMVLVVGEVVLTVLGPPERVVAQDDGNNRSIVLRLDYGQASALLTGDTEEDAERGMVEQGLRLKADVLKIGHHGSNASTSARFLAAVHPQLAVISVGAENRFGHPAPELLQRLQGVEVLRTDQRGRVELVSDGNRWREHTER